MVRGTNITEDGALVVLSNPVRTVPAVVRYRSSLAAAAKDAGGGFVLGGAGVVRRNRLRQVLSPTSLGEGGVAVNRSRARATWLVEAATTPGVYDSLAQLWAASGAGSLQGFDRLTDHIRNHIPNLAGGDADGVVAEVLQLPLAANGVGVAV